MGLLLCILLAGEDMSQHKRFPGSFLLIAAILSIPTMIYTIAHAVEKADAHCAQSNLPINEKADCE